MATITKRTGKGGTTYKVQIRMKGQPAETASFDRLTDARKWASDIESAIRGGRHFGTARRRSFDDLAKKYEASIADTLKSAEARQGHIAYWRTVFTGMVLAEMTPAVVATERDKMAQLAPKRGHAGRRDHHPGDRQSLPRHVVGMLHVRPQGTALDRA